MHIKTRHFTWKWFKGLLIITKTVYICIETGENNWGKIEGGKGRNGVLWCGFGFCVLVCTHILYILPLHCNCIMPSPMYIRSPLTGSGFRTTGWWKIYACGCHWGTTVAERVRVGAGRRDGERELGRAWEKVVTIFICGWIYSTLVQGFKMVSLGYYKDGIKL